MPDLTDRQLNRELDKLEAEHRRLIAEATSELPDGSDAAIAERKRRGKADRFWFFKHYFPHLFDEPFTEIDDRWAEVRDSKRLVLDVEHRGRGKSTRETYAETVRELCTGDSDFTVLTSKTDPQTYPTTLQVRLEFEANARLRQDYGDLAFGPVWGRSHFVLRNGAEVMGHSVASGLRGLRSVVHNRRPDRWKLDDFQDDQDARNPDTITKLLTDIRRKIIPAMRKTGYKLIAIGTRLTEDCAISRLERSQSKAWAKFIHPIADSDGNPTDPVRFDAAFIAAKREELADEPDDFNLEYLLIAVNKDSAFRREWVRHYRREQLEHRPLLIAVYWDPAISRKQGGGDWKAIETWALDPELGHRFCLKAFLSRTASPTEQVAEYFNQVEAVMGRGHWIWVSGYEANGFQELFEFPLEQARAARGLPVEALGQQVVNLIPKDVRIMRMTAAWERGAVHFIQGDSDQDRLVDQHVFFPQRGNLDGPDAAENAWRLIDSLLGIAVPVAGGESENAGYDAGLT